ncbi:MAG: oligosaccharide flippase family protein [Thermodesulfobacteriota bacterium]
MPEKKTKKTGLVSGSVMVTAARVASAACAFVLLWFISQESVADLGAFRTLFVFFLVVEFLPLLGMNQFLIREIARSPGQAADFLLHGVLLGLLVSVFIGAALLALSFYGGYSPAVRAGLPLIMISLPATAAVLCLQSVLVAMGRGTDFGVIQGVEVVARTVVGIVVIETTQNILYVMAGFVAVRCLITAVYWRRVRPLTLPCAARIRMDLVKIFAAMTPQFAGILLLFLVIRFAGPMMVPWMEGDAAAGQFAIVYQFLDLILLVPTAFAVNLMPLLARKAAGSLTDMNRTGKQAMGLIVMLMAPVTVFLAVHSEGLVVFIFGPAYGPAVVLVRIAIWAGLMLVVDQMLSISMIAAERQKADLAALAVGALVTVAGMYVLISAYGVTGASAGLLLGTSSLLAARVILYRRKVGPVSPPALLWRTMAAGVVMGGFMIFYGATGFNMLVSGLAGGALYLLVLAGLGSFNRENRGRFAELLHNR